jgi:thymidylate synthase (FAD)
MKVLNAGSIELLDHMGTDDSIIKAARQCYGSSGNELADERLLESVVKHRHTSCLEHTALTFKVKAPIFVARQWMRHRVGCSYNEKSLRYTEAQMMFYIPDEIRNQPDWMDTEIAQDWDEAIRTSWEIYERLIRVHEIPKEQARAVLPLGIYTEFIFSCNMASLLHFLELRLTKSAQAEIRVYAQAILELIQEVFPKTTKIIRKDMEHA